MEGDRKDGWCVQMVSSKNEPVDGKERKSGWCEVMESSGMSNSGWGDRRVDGSDCIFQE